MIADFVRLVFALIWFVVEVTWYLGVAVVQLVQKCMERRRARRKPWPAPNTADRVAFPE